LKFDCDSVDFYYTIKSSSNFISGPSAGAAFALLTFSELSNLEIPSNLALSGTINSGGYIGNVGGLLQKIRAASRKNIDVVLIPFANKHFIDFSKLNISSSNTSVNISEIINNSKIDLVSFGFDEGVEVVPVATLDEILNYSLGISIQNYDWEFPEFYVDTMKNISEDLCSITSSYLNYLNSSLSSLNISSGGFNEFYFNDSVLNSSYNYSLNLSSFYSDALRLYNLSQIAYDSENYYSSASFCFGANIDLTVINFSNTSLSSLINITNSSIDFAKSKLRKKLDTLNDLQVYSVVSERIFDAGKSFDEALGYLNLSETLVLRRLAYAFQRSKTAISWMNFYNVPSSEKITGSLSNACNLVLKDSESKIQFLELSLDIASDAKDSLNLSSEAKDSGDYALCIYYALQAKAQADIFSSIYGATNEEIDEILDVKRKISENFIAKQYVKGHYPILGFSYLEYASNLANNDPYSALLYYQMAQELSNLDVFLDTNSVSNNFDFSIDSEFTFVGSKKSLFVKGVFLGFLLFLLSFLVFRMISKLIKKD